MLNSEQRLTTNFYGIMTRIIANKINENIWFHQPIRSKRSDTPQFCPRMQPYHTGHVTAPYNHNNVHTHTKITRPYDHAPYDNLITIMKFVISSTLDTYNNH